MKREATSADRIWHACASVITDWWWVSWINVNDENRTIVSITAGITAMQVSRFLSEREEKNADRGHLKCSSFQVQIRMQDSSTFPPRVIRLLLGGS